MNMYYIWLARHRHIFRAVDSPNISPRVAEEAGYSVAVFRILILWKVLPYYVYAILLSFKAIFIPASISLSRQLRLPAIKIHVSFPGRLGCDVTECTSFSVIVLTLRMTIFLPSKLHDCD